MRHLIVSREYPPAPYAPGGIGAYVARLAGLLAERGETVHVIAQRWSGAPLAREALHDGRVVVHRIGHQDLPPDGPGRCDEERARRELEGLRRADFPNQWFSWHAAALMERLIEGSGIDVIEGQDWEAPLYYFLIRRALGLGPRRQPPCIVHLHSPTEFILRFNGADRADPASVTLRRLEEHCIRSADALLCPSSYLARQCERHFDLAPGRVEIIRLPLGGARQLARGPETWANGSICFVGRLEPRKGVIEWVEAAARVALNHPGVRFDLVGADTWRLKPKLLRRMPVRVQHQFRFHGSKPRDEVARFLCAARAAVVPSRWENFPYTLVEAMASGLPVIATRYGGMAELVEDGRTGWLAPDHGIAGLSHVLEVALRRCLATSPKDLEAMGSAAAAAVRLACDDERTTSAHLELRRRLLAQGVTRSGRLPETRGRRPQRPTAAGAAAGIAIAVDAAEAARPVLRTLACQSRPPASVIVVCRERSGARMPDQPASPAVRTVENGGSTRAGAWNAAVAAVPASEAVDFWVFLDQHDRLADDCLERLGLVFETCPEVGIVSFWSGSGAGARHLRIRPCPGLAHQLAGNEVASASAYRTAALPPEPFRAGLPSGYDAWDLANRVMLTGWQAVTFPGLLADRTGEAGARALPLPGVARSVACEMMTPFEPILGCEVRSFLSLYAEPLMPGLDELPPASLRIARLGRRLAWSIRHPAADARSAARRLRQLWFRAPALQRKTSS
jgi:glycosyltransferase involved in cell wall biosynthesis